MSPVIYNAAFADSGFDGVFVAMPVAPGQADAAIEAMRSTDILGLSVTMPHKVDVMAACDRVSERAQKLQAVNCVYRDPADRNVLVGDNTDGAGFVGGLRAELDVDPRGLHCVVIGAGGAARAVVLALAQAGAAQVTIINRNNDRAAAAAALAGTAGAMGSHDDIASADIVVNSTPLGMAGTDHSASMPFDPASARVDAVVCDLIYHPLETPLLAACRQRGLRGQNGVAMLVHQAVVQFEHFTGQTAPLQAMTNAANTAVAARSQA